MYRTTENAEKCTNTYGQISTRLLKQSWKLEPKPWINPCQVWLHPMGHNIRFPTRIFNRRVCIPLCWKMNRDVWGTTAHGRWWHVWDGLLLPSYHWTWNVCWRFVGMHSVLYMLWLSCKGCPWSWRMNRLLTRWHGSIGLGSSDRTWFLWSSLSKQVMTGIVSWSLYRLHQNQSVYIAKLLEPLFQEWWSQRFQLMFFSGVLQQDHCHGPSLSVVGLVAHDGSHSENGVEPIDLHDEESKHATTDPYGFEDVGESILQYPSMGYPTVDPTQIVEDVPCDDGATKMVVHHPAKSIQAVREVQNFLGSLVGNINGFLGTNGLPEKAKCDTSNGCVVGDKRVLLVDDTWGIGIHDRFTSFLTHANDQVLVTPAQFPFLDFAHLDELLQQQVHKSDLGRAWTGARPVLYHASRNHWMKIAFVPGRFDCHWDNPLHPSTCQPWPFHQGVDQWK